MKVTTSIVLILLLALPGVPLMLTWRRALANGESLPVEKRSLMLTLPLLLATFSCLLFFAGLFYQPVIGADYSHRRFLTIYLNLSIALLVGVVAAFGRHRLKGHLALSAGMLVLVWLYLAVVSSVV